MSNRSLLLGTVFEPFPVIECTAYVTTESDYLQSNEASLSIGGIWTIAFWQKRTVAGQASDRRAWFSTQSNTVNGRINWMQRSNSQCLIEIRPDGGSSGNTITWTFANMLTPSASLDWEHIALVYNSNGGSSDTLVTYYNGIDISDKTTSGGPGDVSISKLANQNPNQTDIARTLTMGASRGGGSDWQGQIYNWGAWDVELGADEISRLYYGGSGSQVDPTSDIGDYTSSASLQHFYRFNNPAGRGEDLGVGSPAHNLLDADSGSHSFIEDCPTTELVEIVSYDSSATDYLQAAPQLVGIGDVWTIACWLRRTDTSPNLNSALWEISNGANPKDKIIFSVPSPQNNSLLIFFTDDTGLQFQSKTWTIRDLPNPGPSVIWDHVVCAYNSNGGSADTFAIYWNGTELSTGIKSGIGDPYLIKNADSSTVNQADTSRNISIGAGADGTSGVWEGQIYNWACWDAEFDLAAAAELYNFGNGARLNLELDGTNYSASNLVHLYRFDDSADRGKDRGNGSAMDLDGEASGTHAFNGDYPGF